MVYKQRRHKVAYAQKAAQKWRLTRNIDDREIYAKEIAPSYYYEGYTTFKTEEL